MCGSPSFTHCEVTAKGEQITISAYDASSASRMRSLRFLH